MRRECFSRAWTSPSMHSKFSLKNFVGMGSRGHVEVFSFDTVFLSSSRSGNLKVLISPLRAGVVTTSLLLGVVWDISALMFVILSLKCTANSSHLEGESRLSSVLSAGFRRVRGCQ